MNLKQLADARGRKKKQPTFGVEAEVWGLNIGRNCNVEQVYDDTFEITGDILANVTFRVVPEEIEKMLRTDSVEVNVDSVKVVINHPALCERAVDDADEVIRLAEEYSQGSRQHQGAFDFSVGNLIGYRDLNVWLKCLAYDKADVWGMGKKEFDEYRKLKNELESKGLDFYDYMCFYVTEQAMGDDKACEVFVTFTLSQADNDEYGDYISNLESVLDSYMNQPSDELDEEVDKYARGEKGTDF